MSIWVVVGEFVLRPRNITIFNLKSLRTVRPQSKEYSLCVITLCKDEPINGKKFTTVTTFFGTVFESLDGRVVIKTDSEPPV